MDPIKITEQPSLYHHLEQMPVEEILQHINEEDQKIAIAVRQALPQIKDLAEAVAGKLEAGGRVFYIGAGTSGRLGVLDASECPPTFGVPASMVTGIIAGGDTALRFAVEGAEDDTERAAEDLDQHMLTAKDIVIGLTASGSTPYVVAGLQHCRQKGVATGCIVCNHHTIAAAHADWPVEVIVGPEFITGSTRMKSGTAQKMVLNMISTAAMIRLGRVQDNRMVHMQISNEKLIDRGTKMILEQSDIKDYEQAKALLLRYGSVQLVLEQLHR